MSLLDQAKNVLNGKSPNAPSPSDADRRMDRVDQCKVIWYQWAKDIPNSPKAGFFNGPPSPFPLSASAAELSQARSYDISNHIESFSFAKTMKDAAGSFSLTLSNSFDWTRYLRPGQWIAVFLSSEGDLPLPVEVSASAQKPVGEDLLDKAISFATAVETAPELNLPSGPDSDVVTAVADKLRCLGIIQRVAIKSSTTADGAVEITFVVTGKDFGAIYEDTELWFNAHNAEEKTFTNLINATTSEFQRNLTSLLDVYHDIFLNTTKALKKDPTKFKSFLPQQWVLPDRLIADLSLEIDGDPYFGNLTHLKEFNTTLFENPDPDPLAGLQGKCWDKLKGISQTEFHELFTELSDVGDPKLIFRPIPWAIDKSAFPTLGAAMLSYKDLASGDELAPPQVLNAIVNNATTFKGLKSDPTVRTQHAVNISAVEVEGFDIGADIHNRANFFLVDTMRAMWAQQNSFVLMQKSPTPFPFRNESDIKRYGFKPIFVNVNSFNITNSGLFGTDADRKFMLEATEIMRDFYENGEDYYSGTLQMFGRNDVKLGRVIVTDSSFDGISDMIFYIEGYTDNFTVNGEGTCVWEQSLSLTRGIQASVLDGGNTKDRQVTDPETFHAFDKSAAPADAKGLNKIKKLIKSPF